MTYYEILQVSETASQEVIRVAYKALAKKYHPDVFEGDKTLAEKEMQVINEAYSVLSDFDKRAAYDQQIKEANTSKSTTTSTKQNPTSSRKSASSSPKDSSNPDTQEASEPKDTRVPLLFQWKTIFAALIIAVLGDYKFVFYAFLAIAILRFLAGMGDPAIRLPWYKRIAAFVFCGFALLLSIDHFMLNPSEEASSNTDTTTLTTTDFSIGRAETEGFVETESNAIDSNVLNFSEPTILKDSVILKVHGISNGKALVSVGSSNNETEVQLVDLRNNNDKKVVENLFYGGVDDNGKLIYITMNGNEFKTYNEKGEPFVVLPDESTKAETLYPDKEMYVARRQVSTLDYSGYEYALVRFSGEIVSDWIREFTPSDEWEDLGNGVFYIWDGLCYDIFSNTAFTWPEIDYMDPEEYGHMPINYSDIALNFPFAESDFHGFSKFRDNDCLAYYRIEVLWPTEFYRIDRNGQYERISSLPDIEAVTYIGDMYYCAQTSAIGSGSYDDLRILNMYGEVVIDLTGSNVTNYEFGSSYIVIEQLCDSNSSNTSLYSFYDYSGNQIHEPFNTNGLDLLILEKLDSYVLMNDSGIIVYSMDDKELFHIEPIEIKERQWMLTKDCTYYPVGIATYDGYYVIECIEEENRNTRFFIGEFSGQ